MSSAYTFVIDIVATDRSCLVYTFVIDIVATDRSCLVCIPL